MHHSQPYMCTQAETGRPSDKQTGKGRAVKLIIVKLILAAPCLCDPCDARETPPGACRKVDETMFGSTSHLRLQKMF